MLWWESFTAKSLHNPGLFPSDKFPEVDLLNQKVCSILSLLNYITKLVSDFFCVPCMTLRITIPFSLCHSDK